MATQTISKHQNISVKKYNDSHVSGMNMHLGLCVIYKTGISLGHGYRSQAICMRYKWW